MSYIIFNRIELLSATRAVPPILPRQSGDLLMGNHFSKQPSPLHRIENPDVDQSRHGQIEDVQPPGDRQLP